MPSVNDLLAPFKDVFLAKVDGTIFGIKGTQAVVKILYWFAVLFGCFVFMGGIIATGIDFKQLVTKTEILPMVPTVNYPVIWGCIPKSLLNKTGNIVIGSDCGEAVCPGESFLEDRAKVGGYGPDNADTKFSELKSVDELADKATAPFYEHEKRAKGLMEEIVKSLGDGFGIKGCFVTNYDQVFKPSYDKKTIISLHLKATQAIHEEELYSVMGFFANGSTKAGQSSFGYAGYQNVLQTIGIGIDEEVDAEGMSYLPKTTGTTKEVYSMNTAVTTARYAETADGAQISLKDGVDRGTGKDYERSLRVTYVFYMDTFVRRRTTIRNKSFSEIFAELGASFAASMLVISILFKAGPGNKKVFRYCDTRIKSVVQATKASADQAEKAAPIVADGVQGILDNSASVPPNEEV